MRRLHILGLVCLLVWSIVGCKSGSANADEVLTERTQRSEATEPSSKEDEAGEGGEDIADDEGASKSVIRLFDESEVDESDEGDIAIESASESAVEVKIDTSDCKAFSRTMTSSIDELETACESDDDCVMLELPCAFGCSRPVTNYVGLGEIERLGERYVSECPNCRKMCQPAESMVAVCGARGRCVAETRADDAESIADPESGDETPDEPSEDSE